MYCDDAVWRESADADVLRSLYGYLPTLHDGRIRKVEINTQVRSVVITVDYSDLPEGAEREIDVRLELTFFDVTRLDMPLEATDIFEFNSERKSGGVQTRILMSAGEWLIVESSSFEISLERVGPEVGASGPTLSLR